MNWRVKDKLINAICKGEPLYVKNTGVKVSVDYFGTDINEWSRNRKSTTNPCQVEFLDKPTMKALRLFIKYHIKKNSHSKEMELEGTINIENLSLTPYESKAAKVLYEKKKGNK